MNAYRIVTMKHLSDTQLKALRRLRVPESGNKVKAAMDMLNLTQVPVAEAMGVTQPYVSAVVRGLHQTITVENAHKFAAVFGCQIEDLFPARHAEVA